MTDASVAWLVGLVVVEPVAAERPGGEHEERQPADIAMASVGNATAIVAPRTTDPRWTSSVARLMPTRTSMAR
jgi:hypothetical protein